MSATPSRPAGSTEHVDQLHDDVARAAMQLQELEAEYERAIHDPDVIQEDRDNALALLESARARLRSAQHAVERVEAGTYGTCHICGNPIGRERLDAIPDTTTCISCQAR